jgi:cell wall-associated NlpC family hydrolase
MKKFLPILLLLLCSACATAPGPEAPHALPVADGAPDERMNDLVMYAMSLADTPYRNGGEKEETGFDCSGFVRHVYHKSLNWTLPRTSVEMSRTGEPQEDHLRPGDLVFFNTQQQPFSHVGIYVGDGRFVHAPKTGKAVTLANMRDEYWQSRYDGARRIRLPE